jgi:hypothetical protein
VIGQLPPYALTRSTFAFPALAAQVGRAGLGGPREAALASLIVARLCISLLPPYDISFEDAAARSTQAKNWLCGLTLGVGLKNILTSVIDATGKIDHGAIAEGLDKLLGSPSTGFDSGAREEIEKLAASMRAKR